MKLITQQPCINSAEYIPHINTETWGVEQIIQVYTVEKAQRPNTNPQACLSFLKKNARSLTGKKGSQSQSQMAFHTTGTCHGGKHKGGMTRGTPTPYLTLVSKMKSWNGSPQTSVYLSYNSYQSLPYSCLWLLRTLKHKILSKSFT